jgi:hypothetical protein
MPVDAVIRVAKQQLPGFFPDETIKAILLEEVRAPTPDDDAWHITLSFVRQPAEARSNLFNGRTYRIVTVQPESGDVTAVTIHPIHSDIAYAA